MVRQILWGGDGFEEGGPRIWARDGEVTDLVVARCQQAHMVLRARRRGNTTYDPALNTRVDGKKMAKIWEKVQDEWEMALMEVQGQPVQPRVLWWKKAAASAARGDLRRLVTNRSGHKVSVDTPTMGDVVRMTTGSLSEEKETQWFGLSLLIIIEVCLLI